MTKESFVCSDEKYWIRKRGIPKMHVLAPATTLVVCSLEGPKRCEGCSLSNFKQGDEKETSNDDCAHERPDPVRGGSQMAGHVSDVLGCHVIMQLGGLAKNASFWMQKASLNNFQCSWEVRQDM